MNRRGVAAIVDKRIERINRPYNGYDCIPEFESVGKSLVSSDGKPLVYSTIAKYGKGAAAESQEQELRGRTPAAPEIRTYKWRWVVLGLFFMNNMMTNYVWIMAAPVANLICCYYNVPDTIMNLLSTSYCIVYVLLVVVVSWAMEKYGLRLCVVTASAALALGASIKVAGSGKHFVYQVA